MVNSLVLSILAGMKKAAVIVLIVIVAGGVPSSLLFLHWQELRQWYELNRQQIEILKFPDQPTFSGYPKLVSATKRYLLDHTSRREPLPGSVTLRDLANGGYISTNDVIGMQIVDATFYPRANEDGPKAVSVQVRMSDGTQIVVLTDGSIQQTK